MNKLLTCLSGVASACFLSTAYAQSSVTLYGIVDNGIEYQNGATGSAITARSSGLFATVYGLKGREDIGNGLHVNFQLEQGFSGVNGAATVATAAFNRLAWVGLSGGFGELRVGRQKKPEYLFMNGETDPTGVKSIASPIDSFQDTSVRANNAITYFTPTVYGLTAQFMVAMRDQTTKPSNGLELYNAVLRYTNGPFRSSIGYEQWGSTSGTSLQRVLRAVGSYSVGQARIYMAYQSERQSDNSENINIYELSGSYLFNVANRLSVMYGYAHDRTGQGNNAQQIGFLYEYFFSKSTILYGAAALLQNRNQAQYTLNGTQYSGLTESPGSLVRGIIIGMAHKF